MTQRNPSTAAVLTMVVLTAALLTLAAVPAAADWLVTREGGRVETRGPWQIKGKLVVFTLPDGKLSSLRVSEVDLDVSRRVTAEAAAAAPAPAAPPAQPREAKVVLTDESFKRVAPPEPAAAAPGEETREGEAAEAAASKLAVASWTREEGQSGSVVITGTVRNDAPNDAINSTVTVLLYDETGKLMISGDAVLSSTILPAGRTGSFRAEFPDVFTFAAVKFEARGLHIQTKPDEAAGTGGEAPAKN